jgi:hypothetical protein
LTKLIVAVPLGKLDLGDQGRFNPLEPFHDCWGDALVPAPSSFFLLHKDERA